MRHMDRRISETFFRAIVKSSAVFDEMFSRQSFFRGWSHRWMNAMHLDTRHDT